jgi:hypothetical protein
MIVKPWRILGVGLATLALGLAGASAAAAETFTLTGGTEEGEQGPLAEGEASFLFFDGFEFGTGGECEFEEHIEDGEINTNAAKVDSLSYSLGSNSVPCPGGTVTLGGPATLTVGPGKGANSGNGYTPTKVPIELTLNEDLKYVTTAGCTYEASEFKQVVTGNELEGIAPSAKAKLNKKASKKGCKKSASVAIVFSPTDPTGEEDVELFGSRAF